MKVKLQKSGPYHFEIKGKIIGSDYFRIIAGPCTIENYPDLLAIARKLKAMDIHFLRGGAFKLRTSPYSFQGLGKSALEILARVGEETGMITVSEITCIEDLDVMYRLVNVIQVGTRNMNNFPLLRKLGEIDHPVILKRGMANTVEEWLLAAEHILAAGNRRVILCERGIRTFETATRYTLDLSAIPVVKAQSQLPVFVDPSHSAGIRELIKPLSWAAAAAGADGLIIETHICPDEAVCDAGQTITPEALQQIIVPLPDLLKLWHKTL
ncbi:MAG: 3-deoxy-7-phosphoheptulonate synthase [Candidatus Cloacimonetes bacterium]|nr:3-deoxy-7-phosphoheptulonate synthase [Candidatus Cloacimonadota bacterium]